MEDKNKDKKVSYEVAKLAKEKGFDEACSHYYILDFSSFKADGILYKTSLPECCNNNSNIFQFVKRKKQLHLANAPTQSVLQYWLRTVHKIDIDVCKLQDGYKAYSFVDWDDRIEQTSKFILDRSSISETYEDALEVALKEGLQLIK